MNLRSLKKGCEKGAIRQQKVYEKGTFSLQIVKSRVPSGYQAPVFAITGIVALPRLKNKTLSLVIFVTRH